MTIFENLKAKNIDRLAEWLDEHCDSDSALWWKWWDENYCDKCESIKSETTNTFDYTLEYAYCELNDNCRFFKDMDDIPDSKQIIKMWLESEVDASDDVIMCKDCKNIMYSDCYGECSCSHNGIVKPNDSCEYGIRRNVEEIE